jgi:hypothetical protein
VQVVDGLACVTGRAVSAQAALLVRLASRSGPHQDSLRMRHEDAVVTAWPSAELANDRRLEGLPLGRRARPLLSLE